MQLYARLGQTAVVNEDYGTFEVGNDGTIDVPEVFGKQLNATHIGGQLAWETNTQRHARLLTEETERRKDPATLLAAVEALAAQVAEPVKRGPGRPRKDAQ